MIRKPTSSGRTRRTPSRVVGVEKLEQRQMMAGDTKGIPLISIAVPAQVSRTSDADFMINLDRPVAAGQALTVSYTTRDIGARARTDYAPEVKSVTFFAGESAKLVNIQTLALKPNEASRGLKPASFAVDITGAIDLKGAPAGKIVQKTAITNIVNEAAGFQIDVSFSGNVSDKTKVAARQAADRWQSIITGDLPSTTVNGVYIDDFTLLVKEEAADGPDGILAYASPTRTDANGQMIIQKRATSNTSYGGTAVVDAADRTNPQIRDILIHEIGHALGIGPFWSLEYIRPSFKPLGLVKNLATDNPIYVGRYALAEYQKLVPGAVGIPLESGGAAGTRAAHWSDSVFGDELMTGYISDTMPLSRVTVGALQDLGYSVNYAKADPYKLPVVFMAAAGLTASGGSSNGLSSQVSTGTPGGVFQADTGVTVSTATTTQVAARTANPQYRTSRFAVPTASLVARLEAPRQTAFANLAAREA